LREIYQIAQLLAKEMKNFLPVGGELIRKCLQHTAQEICREKETVLNTVSLSRATMTRRDAVTE
jgi:hypothetical protein